MHSQQSVDIGGSVAVTHNGTSTTITKAGECITHLNNCTSSVEFTHPHSMVVLQCTVMRNKLGYRTHRAHPVTLPVVPRVISSDVLNTLLAVIRGALESYNSIVLPLARYYHIVGANMANLCLETDPGVLNETDSTLLHFLQVHFDVTLTNVCYHRNNNVCTSYVFDDNNPVLANTVVGTSLTDSIAANTSVLVIPVPLGYGITARIDSCTKVEGDRTVTLVSGLRIAMKGIA